MDNENRKSDRIMGMDDQCQNVKFDPTSSNLHRSLTESLLKRENQAHHDLDQILRLKEDLNDETVKRVLRVLSI